MHTSLSVPKSAMGVLAFVLIVAVVAQDSGENGVAVAESSHGQVGRFMLKEATVDTLVIIGDRVLNVVFPLSGHQRPGVFDGVDFDRDVASFDGFSGGLLGRSLAGFHGHFVPNLYPTVKNIQKHQ
ncbi:MAG: hypothetical protein AB1705_19430 [Verrucomicrobiota bacterium]